MVYEAHLKVRFGDVDHARIVYYPRLVGYFHVAFEKFFEEELDLPYDQVLLRENLAFPSVNVTVDFHRPLRFGMKLSVAVRIPRLGRSSIEWVHEVREMGSPELLARASVTTVTVLYDSFQKVETPPWLRKLLGDYQARSGQALPAR